MDFYNIKERQVKRGVFDVFPDFKVCRSKDLMVRGRAFYAIWDQERGLWSTDEYDVQRLVDEKLREHYAVMDQQEGRFNLKLMSDYSTRAWAEFRNYMAHLSDNSHQLDEHLTFANTDVKKKDYVSRRLPYPLEGGKKDAFEEIIGTLYDVDERRKLEWAIGAIVSGDAKSIQKFIVLYGEAGAGKSTILNIIQKLFDGYYTTFEAKALTSSSNSFATEVFKANPLVAIQHDGDLSKIEDNTKLNSIISHEEMVMNEKYKPSYTSRINCFLFMGTNKPVKITDAKSGIIRRLIDVKPSGRKIPTKHYHALMGQIDFELGAIAHHCLEVYRELGKNYYASYRPLDMMMQTDVFFNFVESNFYLFKEQDGVTLSQAYEIYKVYCDESLVEYKAPRHKFREELKSYFANFSDVARVNGAQVRSYYSGFMLDKFKNSPAVKEESPSSLVLDCSESLLDIICGDDPAQYASSNDKPTTKWAEVTSRLSDLNTKEIHYVKLPENHIVIDFDLTGPNGKSLERNIEEASKWPSTYTEVSKSGGGIHLHYIYDGDPKKLSRVFSEGIEIKVFTGNSSLRRKLTRCNNVPIAVINSGLPVKGEVMINLDVVKTEKSVREMITRNLRKEIHQGTKSSVDFIAKILDEAYASGISYDVTDLRPKILAFANNSTNQADTAIKVVSQMKFKSEETSVPVQTERDSELVFYDVEVFPNLFVVVYKKKDKQAVRMINPTAADLEPLMNMNLVGFNCRRYDNHIIYARYIGYSIEELYTLSQRIIAGSNNAMFGEAYNVSYTDVYDFASAANKQGLKKWEIQLGIHHQELGLPWDQPVPEELWLKVAEYCENDVVATEIVFNHLSGDWAARQILAELSGLSVNDTTNQHTIRIVFGDNKKPQDQLVYTDLSIMFPGYKYEFGKSSYRGEDPSEGGRVYSEPGMYFNAAVLDVVSMHPTGIEEMNCFGPYTKNYSDLKKGRVAIKHKDIETLKTLLGGKLIPFIENALSDNPRFTLKDLSNGLKTALNSAYGLTSASFDNPFRDPRNVDNIVAKRGALFMIDLQFAVQAMGFTVAHIKTDSIKIPEATKEIIEFVHEFGSRYGYEMEHEATYEKFCLVNDAVYIAKYSMKDGAPCSDWTATGAQFAQPYVYKTLFTKEPIAFEDVCETKSVTTALYLDMNENLNPDEHDYHFVGKIGSFCPIKPGAGGGLLLREKDGKYNAAPGTKGFRWMEREMVKVLEKEIDIDHSYYAKLVDAAVNNISKYGDFERFVSDEVPGPTPTSTKYIAIKSPDDPPWLMACGEEKYATCLDCPSFIDGWPGDDNLCKKGYDLTGYKIGGRVENLDLMP